MFDYSTRLLELNKLSLLEEQNRIIRDSGHTPENISEAEEEIIEALQLAEERIVEIELAQVQLTNFSKMMHSNPYTNY